MRLERYNRSLKSNMDRFIEELKTSEAQKRVKFKIQYG